MAKLNNKVKLEQLAQRTARLVKMVAKLRTQMTNVEKELADAESPDMLLRARVRRARRNFVDPAKQHRSMMARLEARGGLELLEKYMVEKPRRKKAK